METNFNLRKLLKEKAPEVFNRWARRRVFELTGKLNKLRQEYKIEMDLEKKEKIKEMGSIIRKEIEEIKSLLKS